MLQRYRICQRRKFQDKINIKIFHSLLKCLVQKISNFTYSMLRKFLWKNSNNFWNMKKSSKKLESSGNRSNISKLLANPWPSSVKSNWYNGKCSRLDKIVSYPFSKSKFWMTFNNKILRRQTILIAVNTQEKQKPRKALLNIRKWLRSKMKRLNKSTLNSKESKNKLVSK